jgi:hypothetical protein
MHRWTRRAVITVAAAYATYLLAANVLLNSPAGYALANRQPEKFVAAWGSAWTLYPGHVSANDVRLAGHVRRTVWSVQAHEVRGRVALLPLLTKEVRVPSIVVTGVTGGTTRIDVERAPPPPRPGGWTLRFDSVNAEDVRHAYFNDLVLQGDGIAETGFVKTLRGGSMQVLPSRANFTRGVLWRNGSKLAWDSNVGATFAIAPHRREEAPGIRKLEKTDLEIEIDAVTAGLSLDNRADQKPELNLTDGPGRLSGKLAWHSGSLVPGGNLRLSLPVQGNLDGTFESTEAAVDLRVTGTDIRLAGRVSPIHASVSVDTDLVIQGTTIPLQDAASLARRTSGHFQSRWHFDSLAWLAELLPGSKLVAFDGAGTVLADLKIRDGNVDAGSYLEVPHVAATASALGNRFAGDAQAKITFESAAAGELQPRLTATMQYFEIAPAETPDRPYVHGRDLRIDVVARGNRQSLSDRVHARLWFEDARVPDLRAYNRYLPNSRMKFVDGAGRLSGDLQFDREGGVGAGTFRIVGSGVQLGVADLALLGNIEINTQLRRADLKTHSFNADGSRLSLEGVRVTNGDELLGADWWGDVVLDRARLDWDKPMALDGQLQVRMKDVAVLLALYAQRKDLPGWIGKVVDEGEARIEGRVQWQRETLLLDPLAASNDRFDVLARLRLHEKQPAGDLYARWGALSVGVELAGSKKDYHLVGARKWFDGQPSLAAR